MLMEIDEVAIERGLWARVLTADPDAVAQARKQINGLTLSLHALSISFDSHIVVTLKELEAKNVINSVRCEA